MHADIYLQILLLSAFLFRFMLCGGDFSEFLMTDSVQYGQPKYLNWQKKWASTLDLLITKIILSVFSYLFTIIIFECPAALILLKFQKYSKYIPYFRWAF